MKNEKTTILASIFAFLIFSATIIGIYIFNFRESSISKDPSNWGVLGDYIGGLLNPLISSITLFFLVRTYLSQKEELRQAGVSADEQREISLKTANVQLLNAKISASYKKISLYRGEMDGVTIAINAGNGGRKFISMEGKEYFSDAEQNKYRATMGEKIKSEIALLDGYLSEIQKHTF